MASTQEQELNRITSGKSKDAAKEVRPLKTSPQRLDTESDASEFERQIALSLNIFGQYISRAGLSDEDFGLLGLTREQAKDAEYNVIMSRAVNILAKAIAGNRVPDVLKWEDEGK